MDPTPAADADPTDVGPDTVIIPEAGRLEPAMIRSRPRGTAEARAGRTFDQRELTLLFTDLVGSTRLLEQLGDQQAEVVRREYFRVMDDVAGRHDGGLIKSLGDGLMFQFSSAASAAAAALEMLGAVGRVETQSPLQIRIGLNTGEAVFDDGDYFGKAVVVAARLCDQAAGGQILTTAQSAELFAPRHRQQVKVVGSLHLAGLADPIAAVELLPAVAAAETRRSSLPTLSVLPTPLSRMRLETIGRSDQITELIDLHRRARERSRIVMIEGEAGVGKTQILAALARELFELDVTVLYGACDDWMPPFHPVVTALAPIVKATPGSELLEACGPGAADLQRLVDQHAPGATGTERGRPALFQAIAALLAHVGRERPVLLVLDDLHRADRPTIRLLRHLASTKTGGTLVIGAHRPVSDPESRLGGFLAEARLLDDVDRIELDLLARTDALTLVRDWATAEVDAGVADRIVARAGRNPLMIQESMRQLLADGVLELTDGRLELVGTFDDSTVPATVSEVVRSRVERLPDDVRSALAVASQMGSTFDVAVLRAVHETDAKVLDLVEQAAGADLIVPAPLPGRFTFANEVVRTAVMSEISASEARAIHARVIRHLESGIAAGEHVPAAALAHHAFAALPEGDIAVAAVYAEQAGEEAMSRFAFEDAGKQYRRCLDLGDGLPGGDRRRGRLLRRLGEAEWGSGRPDAARDALRQASELAARTGDALGMAQSAIACHGAGLRALAHEVGVVDEDVVSLLRTSLSALDPQETALRALVTAHLAVALTWAPNADERFQLTEEAVALAHSIDDDDTVVDVLTSAIWTGWAPDNTDERLRLADEVVAAADRLGQPDRAGTAHLVRALGQLELGEISMVHRELAIARTLADQSRDPYLGWMTTVVESTIAHLEGRLDEAEELSVRARDEGPRGQVVTPADTSVGVISVHGAQMAIIRQSQGRLTEVRPAIETFAEELPAVPVWRAARAFVRALDGDVQPARAELRELCANDFESIPFDMLWLSTMIILGQVADEIQDVEAAGALYRALLPHAERVHHHAGSSSWGAVSRTVATMAKVGGDFDEAERWYAHALKTNTDLNADYVLQVTRAEYGDLLLNIRGGVAADEGRRLLDQVIADAGERGYGFAEELAWRALRRSSVSNPAPAVSPVLDQVRRSARTLADRSRAGVTRGVQKAMAHWIDTAGPEQIEERFRSERWQRTLFQAIATSFRPDLAHGFTGSITFQLYNTSPPHKDEPPVWWTLEVGKRRARARPGRAPDAVLVIRIPVVDYLRSVAGTASTFDAMRDGRISVEGDVLLSSKLPIMFGAQTEWNDPA